jgi:phosphoribosylformimino-5-aminoimidazole carboxamide ribotide isomerase
LPADQATRTLANLARRVSILLEKAPALRIIPVIDLKQGQVVRGVGGRRDEYRPIESQLCADAQPQTVAQAFVGLGFREAYIADLDAIEKGTFYFSGAKKQNVPFSGLRLLVDAGLRNAADARRLAEVVVDGKPLGGIVAGLESLDAPATLAAIVREVGPERLIFSLDLKAGVPLTKAPAWQGLSPQQIATIALRAGVRRMIVLDLARVGMGEGVGTESLCRALRCLDAELEIIGGGGVRSAADLDSLARAGCDAALVASALHDGRLSAADCAKPR